MEPLPARHELWDWRYGEFKIVGKVREFGECGQLACRIGSVDPLAVGLCGRAPRAKRRRAVWPAEEAECAAPCRVEPAAHVESERAHAAPQLRLQAWREREHPAIESSAPLLLPFSRCERETAESTRRRRRRWREPDGMLSMRGPPRRWGVDPGGPLRERGPRRPAALPSRERLLCAARDQFGARSLCGRPTAVPVRVAVLRLHGRVEHPDGEEHASFGWDGCALGRIGEPPTLLGRPGPIFGWHPGPAAALRRPRPAVTRWWRPRPAATLATAAPGATGARRPLLLLLPPLCGTHARRR